MRKLCSSMFSVLFITLTTSVFASDPLTIKVDHPGARQYALNTNGTWTICCNTLLDEVCYTTETFDARCGTSINLQTHNNTITPPMVVDLVLNPISISTINVTAKYTNIDPSNPFLITHLFIFQ